MEATIFLIGSRSAYAPELLAMVLETDGVVGELVDNLGDPDWKEKRIPTRDTHHFSYYLCPFTPSSRFEAWLNLSVKSLSPGRALIHPTASVDLAVTLGVGTTVNRLVAIGAGAKVGDHVHINRSSSIGHDSVVEEFSSIGPGVTIAGSVRIGKGSLIGSGAIILPGVQLGEGSTVGAGAVVTQDVAPLATVVGNPARAL